jgi:solute carrier family 13 (sodium-dependent dicarboxylate transporter), member 2/3/5
MSSTHPENPAEIKLDLYCKGMRIHESCTLDEDARVISRTRGGLGSGLETILPDDIFVNIPVVESFALNSPYILKKEQGTYYIYREDGKSEKVCAIKLPYHPRWYDQKTTSGKTMRRVGVMQGTYIGIYPSKACGFWTMDPRVNCKFCSIGLNLGDTEDEEKAVQDVVDTVKAARQELGITFVHFNVGFDFDKALAQLEPYLVAVKKETGLLIGVQAPPEPQFEKYDHLKKIGVDHISFCIEIYNPERFKEVCPGKTEHLSQKLYLDAIEYCSKLMGKGRVAGEIIAGLEPPADSMAAIEHFAKVGAVSTVCVFRPTRGTDYEQLSPPKYEDMWPVFRQMYISCLEHQVPVDMAPNIKVSIVLLAYEGIYFMTEEDKHRYAGEIRRQAMMRAAFRTYFNLRLFLKGA